MVVVVAGRSGLRVGCVDVVFDGSFLKPAEGRLVLISHENAFTATIDMMLNAKCPYDRS